MNAIMTNGGVFARCGGTVTLNRHESFRWHAEARAIGTERPYLALGGEMVDNRYRGDRAIIACGCLHDEIKTYAPGAARFLRLHLADAVTGAPMHAAENALYWLAGYTASLEHDLGQRYHGGSGSNAKTPGRCAEILADHLRITIPEAQALAVRCIEVCPEEWRHDYALPLARRVLAEAIEAMRPRWQAEAAEFVDWITANASSDRAPEFQSRVAYMRETFPAEVAS